MKRVFLNLIFTLAAAIFATSAMAQNFMEDPRYGANPEERQRNVQTLNYFSDAYQKQDYDVAAGFLQELLKNAPGATQNLYIQGAVIYRDKINRATSVADRDILIDSLMLLYDMRIEYYGSASPGEAAILGNKVRDYYAMKTDDYQKLIPMFEKSIETGGDGVGPDIMISYLKLLSDQYVLDNIEAEMILAVYDNLLPVFERGGEAVAEQKTIFESLFISSGVANCENLEKVFRPRIEADPSLENIEKAFASVSRVNCTTDFFFELAEMYHALKPGAATAMALAARFEEQRDFAKADQYLNDAFAQETDPVQRANLLVRMAGNKINQSSVREAADLARQATQINPENGLAYLVLAQAYASGVNQQCPAGFERQAAYWLVVDYFNQARERLANDPNNLAVVNSQIRSYSDGFPSAEDCHFRELNTGASYTVNCGWVSGRTTVRPNSRR